MTSMIRRVLHQLKERGALCEPVKDHVSTHMGGFKCTYTVRVPKDYEVVNRIYIEHDHSDESMTTIKTRIEVFREMMDRD